MGIFLKKIKMDRELCDSYREFCDYMTKLGVGVGVLLVFLIQYSPEKHTACLLEAISMVTSCTIFLQKTRKDNPNF